MITIRKYEDSDFEKVRYICLNADGPDEAPDEKTAPFFFATYCDYYTENEPENCFVLDSDGEAVGYIIAAEDYDSFKKIFDEKYLPRVRHYGQPRYGWAVHSSDEQGEVKESYPAHLHINILPEYQRMGLGSRLIDTLINHLKEKGIVGVCLTCGWFNKNAIAFYKKYGFKLLSFKEKGEYLFGMKIE